MSEKPVKLVEKKLWHVGWRMCQDNFEILHADILRKIKRFEGKKLQTREKTQSHEIIYARNTSTFLVVKNLLCKYLK